MGLIHWVKRHRVVTVAGAAGLAMCGYFAYDAARVALLPDTPVAIELPVATPVSASAGDSVYAIDASQSKATVSVEEHLAGVTTTASLSTNSIAGELALNSTTPSQSKVGEIVANIEQLTSNNSLRDKIVRDQYLESTTYPLATLSESTIQGLDGLASATTSAPITMTSKLHVKRTTNPVTWTGTAAFDGTRITASMSTTIKLSDFEAGPINKVGLVSTSDDATLKIELVALPKGQSTTAPVPLNQVETRASAVSFANDIAPVLADNCATCHNTGTLGAHVWKLDTAGDAAAVAQGIATVTQARYMPPWPPSDIGVPVQHPRGLSAKQISDIAEWAAAGGPLDVSPDTAVTKEGEPEVKLPNVDQELNLPEAFVGDPTRRDIYQCFIFDPHVTETKYLTGYQFLPERLDIVHHALVYKQRADTRAAFQAKDDASPQPGWECAAGMDGGIGGDLVSGWVPGQRPRDFGDNVGFEFRPNEFMVAQIHYHYDKDAPGDQSKMTLEWTAPTPDMQALRTRTLIGPVELPCPSGSTEPLCDRTAAIADVNARFGPSGDRIANGLHMLCNSSIESVAALSDGTTATTRCDYNINRPGTLVDFMGHMHTLGKSYRMTLNKGTPSEKVLLDIPKWDFAWQLNYQPVEPIALKAGDKINVECVWDRRQDPQRPLRYIVFAEGTEDEMCFSTITTINEKR